MNYDIAVIRGDGIGPKSSMKRFAYWTLRRNGSVLP
jgi:hypothetical protein